MEDETQFSFDFTKSIQTFFTLVLENMHLIFSHI